MAEGLQNFINFPTHPLRSEINVTAINSMFFYNYAKNFVYDGETHNSWELHLVNSGKQIIKNSGKNFTLNPSQAFLHKPLSYHGTLSFYDYSAASIVSFTCDSPELEKIWGRVLNLNQYECSLFTNIITEGETLFQANPSTFWFSNTQSKPHPEFAAEQVIKNTLELLLVSLLRNSKSHENEENKKKNNTSETNAVVTDVIDYIKANFMNDFSLEKLSKELSYHPTYLCRVFKDDMGCSIVTYLTRIRIFEAQKLLTQGNIPIKKIVDMTGFSTVQYFNVLFKRYTHMTPLQFRNSVITCSIINNSMFNL